MNKNNNYKKLAVFILASLVFLYIGISIWEMQKNTQIVPPRTFSSFPAQSLVENFAQVPFRPQIEGPYGLGFQKTYEPVPLFSNFIPPLLGSDFKLNSFIRREKMESNGPTITNGNKRTLPDQTSVGPARNPIILVPDIGASRILVRWSKPATLSVKKIDAYGSFQEQTKWSCKDTETEWQLLWFPKDKKGLSRYCWQDLTKTMLIDKDLVNTDQVNTLVDTMGSMNFETDIYNTFIEAMYALSYIQGSTLFGASYDHRLIAGNKYFSEWSRTLSLLIEKSVKFNGRRAIITGHGLGALIANKFLVEMSQEWKDTYIAGFVSISGTFGTVPKALRVLISGDILPNKEDQDLVRNASLNASGLHLMLPSKSSDNDQYKDIIRYNQDIYGSKDVSKILDIVSESLYDKDLSKVYDLSSEFKSNALKAPNVPVNIFIGTTVDTEVGYQYSDLIHDPVDIRYTDGDGTVPIMTLVRPKEWSKEQTQIVTFKEYPRAEHSKILKLFEPMTDLMSLIKVYNE